MTTQMVDKSNFDNKQYKADLQCAYDCGYVKGANRSMNDIELCQELMTRAEEYQKQMEREFAIEELEKIKTEIQGLIDFEESCCGNTTLGYECLSVINNKISELKGDNK